MKAHAIRASVFFGVTVILLVYVISIGIKNYFRYNGFKQEYQADFQKLDDEKSVYLGYVQELQKVKTTDYLDYLIRVNLHYIKPDEIIYKFVKD